MRIKSEEDILNEAIRKQIITEIEAGENQARKAEAYRRYEIWKDRTKDYVRDRLSKYLDPSTVAEMEYALSNISICKKIVGKLAKVYANGVERKFEKDEDTKKLELLDKKLSATAQMKTVNRHLKLQRNALLYIKPVMWKTSEDVEKWKPSWIPMSPFLYDVVEQDSDRTKPLCFILSNYDKPKILSSEVAADNGTSVPHKPNGIAPLHRGNSRDELIADKKEDEGANESTKIYIWWTDKYHFTTKGSQIVDPSTHEPFEVGEEKEAILNPIEEKPFIDMHIDQEGHYWAEGGEDLIDGAILINSLLSNSHHIGHTQGYGQLVLTGPKLPSTIKLGPNKSINLEQASTDEPTPSAEFITASPPLAELQQQIEMYLALLLTTNDLSTTGIASNLSGGVLAPSGIALAIDKAESLEDIKDQREIFSNAERPAWRITAKWLQYFNEQNELDEDFEDLVIPVEGELSVEFKDAQIIMSESEKLEGLNKRKDLGINTMIELIQKDRGCTEDEAKKILKSITEEALERAEKAMANQINKDADGNPIEGEVDENGEPIEQENEDDEDNSQQQ